MRLNFSFREHSFLYGIHSFFLMREGGLLGFGGGPCEKKTASKGGSGETFHCFNFKCYYDKKRCSAFPQLLRRNFKNKSDFF